MKHAWMLLLALAICSPSQAGWRVTSHSQVTVLVENSAHQLLGSRTWIGNAESEGGSQFAEPLTTWFSLELDDLYGSALFENVALLSNVGNTVWVSSNADDPQFSAFVGVLTDGLDGTLWGKVTLKADGSFAGGSGTGYGESSFFGEDQDHDFAGMTIGRIGLRVDEATVTQAPADVPEPCSMISLLCGIIGAGGYALRRRRRG